MEGPAGIGKTSLLEATGEIARRAGVRSLRARGGELEREYAFGVARQLLEREVAALDAAERDAVLGGAARAAEPIVNPGALPGSPAVTGAPGEELAFMVSHGLYWLICNLADAGPLLLGVDDAQWCDRGSARFLSYLARRLEELPVLLVAAVRSGEPGSHAAAAALSEGCPRLLRPRPLTNAAASQLVRRKMSAPADQDFCRECCRVSGGNPFLLGALVDELVAERISPISANVERLTGVQAPTVARGLLARLARIGPEAGALARAVAVLGSAELRDAAALAGADLATAARTVDALADAEVLARQRPLEFAHPIARQVVYESIPPAQRALDHGRAAWLYAEPVPDYERMASHLLKSEPAGDATVVGALRAAAQLALGRGAPDAACAHLQRALREPPQAADLPDVTRELGTAELLAREPAAIEHLSSALKITVQSVPRAEIALLIGKAQLNASRLAEADATLGAAITELGDHDGELGVLLETWRSSLGVLDRRFRARLEQRLPQLRSLADAAGPATRGLLILLAYRDAMAGAPRKEVLELADRGLDSGRFLAEDAAGGPPLPLAMRLLSWIDELDRADNVAGYLLDAARGGSIVAFAIASVCAASTAMRRGMLAEAEAEARTALDLAVQHDLRFYEPFARAMLGEALLERGELDQAAAAMDEIDIGRFRGIGPYGLLLYVRGRLRAARGDRAGAAEDLCECGEIYEQLGYTNPNILPWRSALALVQPDRCAGRMLADEELTRARQAEQPRGIGVALRTLALLSDRNERMALLEEATDALRSSPSALELARTLTDYGTALARAGRRTAARGPLLRAMDLAGRCGAAVLANRARDELRAIGARPRRERLTGVESLTPGELRVARLAAKGLTNRQIAQSLFVTNKTVGTHLGHIYAKLAVNDRESLARLLQ